MGPAGYAYFSAVYITAEILALPAIPLTASAGYLFGAVPGTATVRNRPRSLSNTLLTHSLSVPRPSQVLFSATIAAGASFLIGRYLLRSKVESFVADNPKLRVRACCPSLVPALAPVSQPSLKGHGVTHSTFSLRPCRHSTRPSVKRASKSSFC